MAGHLQEKLLNHKELFPLAVQRGHKIRRMARRFIAGETPPEALATIYKLRQQQCAFTLDLLGEATLTEEEPQAYQQRYLALLRVQQAPCHVFMCRSS